MSDQIPAQGSQQDTGTTPQTPITPTEPQQQGDPNLQQGGSVPPQNAAPVLDPTVARLIQDSIRSQAERAERAERELNELRNKVNTQPAPPPLTPEQQSEQFLTRPIDTVKDIVSRQIAEQVNPINQMMQQYIQQQQRTAAVENAKAQLRMNKQSFPHFALIESDFDVAIQQVPNIDNNTVVMLYNMLVGQAYTTGRLNQQQQRTSVQQQPQQQFSQPPQNNNMLPPHLRPTAPAAPQNTQTQQVNLTEQERALARYYRMTDQEYVEFRDSQNFFVKPNAGSK
jgi:hypothetical protein